jgi:hypothetical protein
VRSDLRAQRVKQASLPVIRSGFSKYIEGIMRAHPGKTGGGRGTLFFILSNAMKALVSVP